MDPGSEAPQPRSGAAGNVSMSLSTAYESILPVFTGNCTGQSQLRLVFWLTWSMDPEL